MPTFNEVAVNLPREQIDRMRDALELGRWPDGQQLAAGQRETTMAAVIAWESYHLSPDQRSGYMPSHPKAQQRSGQIPTVTKDDD